MDRVTEAVLNRDNEALNACYAPDAVVDTPDRGTRNGSDALVAYMNEFSAGFSDIGWEEIQKHEVGSVAIDEGYFLGKHTNPITAPTGEAIEPTGKKIRVRECDIATSRRACRQGGDDRPGDEADEACGPVAANHPRRRSRPSSRRSCGRARPEPRSPTRSTRGTASCTGPERRPLV
jgi:hypothetical protein